MGMGRPEKERPAALVPNMTGRFLSGPARGAAHRSPIPLFREEGFGAGSRVPSRVRSPANELWRPECSGSRFRPAAALGLHGHLAPAFTPAEAGIGIVGVRPRLQQRDCPRFARGSSRRQHPEMFSLPPISRKGNRRPVCAARMVCASLGRKAVRLSRPAEQSESGKCETSPSVRSHGVGRTGRGNTAGLGNGAACP